MATINDQLDEFSAPNLDRDAKASDPLWFLKPLASLKLTVALFAAGIFIVFYGTLAQVEKDMWAVIDDYFRAKLAWIDFRLFFPPSFFPPSNSFCERLQNLKGGFYFPGGWTIGLLLAINLLAAHLFRFKLQAKGTRLIFGLVVFAIGAAFTWLICGGLQASSGIHGISIIAWPTLWKVLQVLLVVAWVASIVKLVQMENPFRLVWNCMLALTVVLGGLVLYCLFGGAAIRPADPSMRILWQLIQAALAGVISLAASILLFKKRGGIVVIHLGVALMMFGELLVGLFAVEEQIQIPEGQTVNFARDLRDIELAIIDPSDENEERVTVVPGSLLKVGKTIDHADVPFKIEVLERFDNANLTSPSDAKENLATAGGGLRLVATEARKASGADSSGAVDMASIYAKVTPKNPGDFDEQTYLFCQQFGDGELTIGQDRPERIKVGDSTYNVALRFKRTYKPYSMRLLDISKTDYQGTSTPRDYSSYVHLVDESNNFDDDSIRIWMNNPLRYSGETFYQSSYSPPAAGRPETTTISVVSNMGWMIPYVACMVAFVGMFYHFGLTLVRFLSRIERDGAPTLDHITGEVSDADKPTPSDRKGTSQNDGKRAPIPASWGIATLAIPAVMIGFVLLFAVSKARPAKPNQDGIDLALFGKTPIVFEGRAKPIDTLARNSLKRISDKQRLIDHEGKKHPATLWLLDVMTQSDAAEEHRVFRIPNGDVRQRLGLERRKGFLYSISEFRDKVFDGYAYNDEFTKDIQRVREAAKKDASQLSTYQRKLLEFDGRLSQYRRLADSFVPLPFPAAPTPEDMQKDPAATDKTIKRIQELMVAVPKMDAFLKEKQPPLIVPNFGDDETTDDVWQSYAGAVNRAYVKRILMGGEVDRGVLAWTRIMDAHVSRKPAEFNERVAEYQTMLEEAAFEDVDSSKVSFEAFFNHFAPFTNAIAFYIFALLITAASWLFGNRSFNRAALWLVFATLMLHTFALGARIYISGRPPVTNLYSSAVFIGWGCVLFGLIFERLFPIGIGNFVSSVCGFSTLMIAHGIDGNGGLAAGGDTFTVLQAVLDTQFWLATHVVCISLGYATTFVAGALGIMSIFARAFGLTKGDTSRDSIGATLARMIYGTLCFAIFFSFIGTVLGGLWADDSWGRFWGWDPKENGALIIVLWNALILHARWGRIVGSHGMAILAVLGNVTTTWSWFGVNELDIGLHSYGGSDASVVFYLGIFVLSQAVIAALGLLTRFWQPAT